jgi:anti-anti-sigma factor
MPVERFEAKVRYQAGIAIIDLYGEINASTADTLNAAYSEALAQNPSTILLNFSHVHYINSTGLALIVGLLAQTLQANLRLATYGLSDHYIETFHITRLVDFVEIFPDEVSALNALNVTNSEF